MNLENFDWELGTGWEEPLWEILPVHKINTENTSKDQTGRKGDQSIKIGK